MDFITFVFILVSAALLHPGAGETEDSDGRIIGGNDAHLGELPYQVSLQRKYYFGNGSFHWCGGSIIDKRHVITAGHCASGLPVAELRVIAGVLSKAWQTTEGSKVERDVSDIFIHPEFVYEIYLNDIAIIRVTEVFPSDNPYVRPIPLRRIPALEGTNCTVSGWGTMSNGSLADYLQEVQLPFIPYESCRDIYNASNYTENPIAPGMSCAGFMEGGKDACGGDSGGPLECEGQLTGVISWGNDCALPLYPGVYADITFYVDWISKTIAESEATRRVCRSFMILRNMPMPLQICWEQS